MAIISPPVILLVNEVEAHSERNACLFEVLNFELYPRYFKIF